MTYFENRYLTLDEMKVNAEFIYSWLLGYGWTAESICGMLGNMQTESTINGGIWESLTPDLDRGYGLVQWTPANKYFNWLFASGYNDGTETQLLRIIYEMDNGLQWIPSLAGGMTFYEFSQSTQSPYDLAMLFIKAYERPANPNQPIRGTQAEYWYEYLTGIIPPQPPTSGNKEVELFLSGAMNVWYPKY